MCLGKNEPGGPWRCLGHARKAYRLASAEVGSASFEKRQAHTARGTAERAWVETEDLIVNARRERDRATTATDKRHWDEVIETNQAAMPRLLQDHTDARERYAKAVAAETAAKTKLAAARDAHDATTQGMDNLSLKINAIDAKAEAEANRPSTEDDEGDESPAKAALAEERAALAARRTAAEARLNEEAQGRNGAIQDSADAHAASEDKATAEYEVNESQRAIDGAQTDEERAEAKARNDEAKAYLRDVHRRERKRSKLQPFTASDRGRFAFAADAEVYDGIATSHRRVVGLDGKPKVEVHMVRDVDDARTEARVEFDAARLDRERRSLHSLGDAEGARRYPTTAAVMSMLSRDSSWRPGTGLAAEEPAPSDHPVEAGKSAKQALDRLFGPPTDDGDMSAQ